MFKQILYMGVCSITTLAATSAAQADSLPDDHAPIGVMGDHLHKQGSWMVSYRYEHTRTSGYRDGSNSISNASVIDAYGEAATKMDMGMHMFEIMYGVNDDLTLMIMPQYMQMSMLHQSSHGGGHSHEHSVEGFGDTEVTGLYSVYDSQNENTRYKAHLNLGVSLPTGSIDETFTDHHGTVYHLPYNMQFGSGTFDPIIGATYVGDSPDWSWGAQTLNYIRIGKNNEGYRQGNKYTATTWIARNVNDFTSVSFRLDGQVWENVSGRDSSLPVTAISGANPNEQAGERVMANIGINLLSGENQGVFSGHRLTAEFGVPLYQRFSGPQPDMDYNFTLGWQLAF